MTSNELIFLILTTAMLFKNSFNNRMLPQKYTLLVSSCPSFLDPNHVFSLLHNAELYLLRLLKSVYKENVQRHKFRE